MMLSATLQARAMFLLTNEYCCCCCCCCQLVREFESGTCACGKVDPLSWKRNLLFTIAILKSSGSACVSSQLLLGGRPREVQQFHANADCVLLSFHTFRFVRALRIHRNLPVLRSVFVWMMAWRSLRWFSFGLIFVRQKERTAAVKWAARIVNRVRCAVIWMDVLHSFDFFAGSNKYRAVLYFRASLIKVTIFYWNINVSICLFSCIRLRS